ncbi:MAG: L,D-transpeptidase family protein [Campylobacterales bacterium]|nr:L,D-transpeptidase family protein [Campylobacterales bacterium]
MSRVFVGLLLSLSFLQGIDLADLYISGKKDEVLKYLDEQISKKEYWENKLGNNDFRFGYYTNKKDVLIACKECDRLRHFKIEKEIQTSLKDLNATFGQVKGDKKREGDLKTPIGAYHFIEKLDKSKNLNQFYGPYAFVTNYPNLFDKSLKKNGSGIWLHGFPLEGERDPKTKGCIAVDNNCLEDIEKEIDFTNTIVLINENRENLATNEEILNVLTSLYQWRRAWINNDLDNYISFYSEDFKRADGLNLQRFTNLKKEIFSKNRYTEIYFKDLEVIPYPNSIGKRIYKIKFFEIYRSNIHKFKGYKTLYVEVDPLDERFKIILES